MRAYLTLRYVLSFPCNFTHNTSRRPPSRHEPQDRRVPAPSLAKARMQVLRGYGLPVEDSVAGLEEVLVFSHEAPGMRHDNFWRWVGRCQFRQCFHKRRGIDGVEDHIAHNDEVERQPFLYRIDGVGAFGQTEDRRRVAWYAEAVGIISRCVKPPFTLRQNRGSEFASFASAAGGIHTTHAERRAARQSSFTRTTNATTPQVRCCVVDPRQARSHGLPGPVLALHEREREAEKQAARKTRRI